MALTLSGSGITSANIVDGTITNTDINASANIPASKLSGAGKVLQVVSVERRSHMTLSADNTVDWITLNITPTSATSKIKLSVMGGVSCSSGNNFSMLLLHRNDTNIAFGDSVASSTPCWIDIGCRGSGQGDTYIYQQKPFSGVYIDSPNTTSAITYKAKVRNKVNGTLYLGRTSDTIDSNRTTTMGMLIAEEIGA